MRMWRVAAMILPIVVVVACGGGGGGGVAGPVAGKSNNALLAGLAVSPGTFSPVFSSATTTYTDAVTVSTSTVGITATTGSSKATLQVNGATVVSGATCSVSVPVGTTDIPVTVTAEDGTTTRTYTISFSRPGVGLSPAAVDVHPDHAAQVSAVLASPSVGTTVVSLSSSSTSRVTVPATVDVTDGMTQVAFSATAVANGPAAVTITATLGGDSATATVNVLSAVCGNGIIDVGEQCDDGNTNDNDGCSHVCQQESGWSCTGEPSACSTTCGDNIVAGSEQCDAGGANGTTTCGCQNSCLYASVSTTCAAATQCTEAATCDGVGSCATPSNKADGTGCTLANASSTCQGGVCGGSGATVTCASGFGDCDGNAANGCETDLMSDLNHCGNCGNACSAGQVCTGGACVSSLKAIGSVCAAGSECTSGFCVDGYCCNSACNGGACVSCSAAYTGGSNGTCANVRAGARVCRASAGLCDMAEYCDGTSVCPADGFQPNTYLCQSASCSGLTYNNAAYCTGAGASCPASSTTSCDDSDACTTDICTLSGCTHTPISCDDGDACTADACDSLLGCTHTPIICPAPDQCHTAGTCNPATGACSYPAAPDGTACDDGNACTSTDVCTSGLCSGSVFSCVDANPCTNAVCDGAGGCTYSNVPNGTICGSGLTCQNGTCQ